MRLKKYIDSLIKPIKTNSKLNGQDKSLISLFPINFVSHDVIKVISSDESIIIQIGFGENVLDFIISQVFSQFLSNFFEFCYGEFSSSVDIERSKNFVNFNSAFFIAKFSCGKSQEFSEVNTSGLIIIEFSEDLIYEFVLSSESKAFESSF